MRASKLAERLNAQFLGPGDPEINSVASIVEAQEGQVAFLHNSKYRKYLSDTKASCVVMLEQDVPEKRAIAAIVSENPHRAMAEAVEVLYPQEMPLPAIHPTAVIDPTATIGDDIVIGAQVSIGPDCVIGDRSRIGAGCSISGAHIGPNCTIYPNVTIYPKTWIGEKCVVHAGSVLGSDGFGFAPTEDGILKVRQVGKLIIEQEVEIGACCTIDRGSFNETRIGRGTKIDNLVHIAHNCKIGEFCLIAAQSGLAGSTVLGDRVMVAGQVGFAGHQKIGDRSIFLAKSGVSGDFPPDTTVFGYPGKDRMTAHREVAYIARLGELFKRVKELEKKLED